MELCLRRGNLHITFYYATRHLKNIYFKQKIIILNIKMCLMA